MTTTPDIRDLVRRLQGPVRQAAQDLIDAAFNNRKGRGVHFSIPAKPDEDTDLVLVAGIKDAAAALEQLIEAVEEAERVIGPFAIKLSELEDDADYPPITKHQQVVETYVSLDDLRAASAWRAKHGAGR